MRKEITDMKLRDWIIVLMLVPCLAVGQQQQRASERFAQVRFAGVKTGITQSLPPIACWFWTDKEFTGDGFKTFIHRYGEHSSIGLITASLRHPGELTDPAVRDRIGRAARYAEAHGMGLVMDLDVRLARASFMQRFPDQLQELVLVREFSVTADGEAKLRVESPTFFDHYTHGRNPYAPVGSRLLGVYAYEKAHGLIKKGSIEDITASSTVATGPDYLDVTVGGAPAADGRTFCALVAVTLNTPDVFAQDLLDYQREIIRSYKESGLVGAAKDEWGFPGRVDPPMTDLWFSSAMAALYKKRNRNRDLSRDLLLMAIGEQGKEREREVAINHYMAINYERNAEIETDFYEAVKETFGQQAFVGTHPTWFPFPNSSELFKNGLNWWNSKRDLAQTDEATPFAARTALAKKWNSPVWYNMFYDPDVKTYARELWPAVLGGGRLNIHQPFPVEMETLDASISLLKGDLFAAIQRIQLLDYISASPVNSPVAVVFGHPAASNWSNGELFADVGLDLTNRFWEKGIYADLIPSTEIVNASLTVNAHGKVQYGPQQYEAVVYYHPEFDYPEVERFFDRAAHAGTSVLYRVGDKEVDFYGKPVRAKRKGGRVVGVEEAVNGVLDALKSVEGTVQTLGEIRGLASFPASVMPHASGHIRLLDGTYIIASGERQLMGDTIQRQLKVDGQSVAVDAIGVAGFRFDQKGDLVALACGGMKSFEAGNVSIRLPERMDVALIKDSDGWRGIVHGFEGPIPPDLAAFTANWTRVAVQEALTE